MILFGSEVLFVVLLAIIVDAVVGDPDWLWRRFPHPVVGVGAVIFFLEKRLNRPSEQSRQAGRLLGVLLLVCLVGGFGLLAYWVETLLWSLGVFGGVVIAVIGAIFIAQKSLYQHVKAVADALNRSGEDDLTDARKAVSMIVGRDPEKLDRPGIARAAIESLAENFSDGIVAPIFWFALLGLPGLVIYKVTNTADSMIGHKNERYMWFGWAAARFDDLLNLAPARLTALLLVFAPFARKNARPTGDLWHRIRVDAPRHRSPNAGWPEAATAGRLDIALSGPRYYGTELVDEPFVNPEGSRDIDAREVNEALRLYAAACVLEGVVIGCLAVLLAVF